MKNKWTVLIILWLGFLSIKASAQQQVGFREALHKALQQNPDIVLSRLETLRLELAANQLADPFSLKFSVGSGLAFSSGFPLSIEGAAPSIVQGQAARRLFDRELAFQVEAARRRKELGKLTQEEKAQLVARQLLETWVELQLLEETRALTEEQAEALKTILNHVQKRADAGLLLPVDVHQVEVRLLQHRAQLQATELQLLRARARLNLLLGNRVDAAVEPVGEAPDLRIPYQSGDDAVAAGLQWSPALRRFRQQLEIARLQLKSAEAARLPKVGLIAQYAVLGRFNNYEDFFRRFQRHNFQLGVSFELPLLRGSGVEARKLQQLTKIQQLETELAATTQQVRYQLRDLFLQVQHARTMLEVAEATAALEAEKLRIVEVRMAEGVASPAERAEAEITYLESRKQVEDRRANWVRLKAALLAQTGELTRQLLASSQ